MVEAFTKKELKTMIKQLELNIKKFKEGGRNQQNSINLYNLIIIGSHSALRISDILEIENKEQLQKNIREIKTKKNRKSFIQEDVITLLKYDFNFKKTNGYKINLIKSLKKLYIKCFPQSKKNIGSHSLRKFVATSLYKNNIKIEIISHILNHSNIKNTLVYMGINDEYAQESLNSIKLF